MKNKCYLLYDVEFCGEVSIQIIKGIILMPDESAARWAAKIAQIAYEEIEELETVDNDSTIFKA